LKQSTVRLGVLTMLLAGTGEPAPAKPAPPADGVRLAAAWFSRPVRAAVRGAAGRLADPGCAAVLDDFGDSEGRPLRRRLAAIGVDAAAYTRRVLFYDGSNEPQCRRRRGLLAYTAPGFRFVRVCPPLAALGAADPKAAEIVIIHEVLHTLGLAENPPSSDEITARVLARCGPTARTPVPRERP